MLRSLRCPKGKVGVSKHEAAPIILRDGRPRSPVRPPQDEGGATPSGRL